MKSSWSILLLSLVLLCAGEARAQVTCDITVNSPDLIQNAVNQAQAGQTVCLYGTFTGQMVVLTSANSGVTVTSGPGQTAVLDGTGLTTTTPVGGYGILSAFAFDNGASDITIEGLEIENYLYTECCGVGNGVTAWGVTTSNITVRNNNIHDNYWDAVMVGSEGDTMQTGWAIHDNTATNNGAYQIELTNCSGCSAHDNTITGVSTIGILIQARNTRANSGLVAVRGVSVKNNTISGGEYAGAYIFAEATDVNYNPITGAYATLQSVSFTGNQITNSLGALVWGFGGGSTSGGPALVFNPSLVKNTFSCGGSGTGIQLVDGNTVNAKVVNDDYSGCTSNIGNGGTSTKIPKGLGLQK